jgi:hypothetical protein
LGANFQSEESLGMCFVSEVEIISYYGRLFKILCTHISLGMFFFVLEVYHLLLWSSVYNIMYPISKLPHNLLIVYGV